MYFGAAALVGCGFSAENPPPGSGGSQSGGTTVTQSGGSGSGGSQSGGTTGTQSGGSGGNESGGTTVTPSGGSGGNQSGGTTVQPSGTGGSSTPPRGTGGRTQGTGGSGTTPGTGGGSTPPSGTGGRVQGTGGSGTTPGTGGSTPGTGGSIPGTGGSTGIALPGDIMAKAPGNKVVSAHSTVRVIVSTYTGPLYQLCKGTFAAGPSSCKGTTQDVGSKDGYADVAAHEAYCPSTGCTITKIYDQSGQGNHLEPAPRGGAKGTPDNPANANDLKVTVNGHSAYAILIKPGIGYRTGCTQCNIKTGVGMAKGDEPTTHYWVTSAKDLIDGCCYDYGNAETTSNDDGNGHMETLYFGGGVVWGTGYGGKPGPWIMADLENGLYAGWENKQDKNISTNKKLPFDFVTGFVIGDTRDKNGGKGRFALYGADATGVDATYGKLAVMYDGIRPEKPGYVPMNKQGSIILGIGGDNSNGAGGRYYEGAISVGPVLTKEVCDQMQTAIVAAKYK
jgi:hypothetical protein